MSWSSSLFSVNHRWGESFLAVGNEVGEVFLLSCQNGDLQVASLLSVAESSITNIAWTEWQADASVGLIVTTAEGGVFTIDLKTTRHTNHRAVISSDPVIQVIECEGTGICSRLACSEWVVCPREEPSTSLCNRMTS